MNARFERREPGLRQQLVGALLLCLACAQFQLRILQAVAQGLKRGDAEAKDQIHGHAERE